MKIFSTLILSILLSPVCYSQNNDQNVGVIGVGTLPGNLVVSSTGGAIYNVPLDLPAGRLGIKPQISLCYNSQQKNSRMLGQGWSVTGFSAISRNNRTLYYNGGNGPVDFVDDELMLDGQHLINIQGNEYRTEEDIYSKIVSLDDGMNGRYFKVYTKDGMIMEYGNTPDSRQGSSNNIDNNPLAWHLNKTTDRLGNCIVYIYERNTSPDASVRPIEIYYTCYKDNLNGDTKIRFNYFSTDAALQQTYYYQKNGQPFINTNNGLIQDIQIFQNGGSTLLRDYQINYFDRKGVCKEFFIKDITLTNYQNGSPTSIKPTTFSWDFYQPAYQTSAIGDEYIKSQSTFQSIALDLDGDHIDHIAVYYSRISDPEHWNDPPTHVITLYGINTSYSPELLVTGYLRSFQAIDWDNNGDDELLVVDDNGLKIYDYNTNNGTLNQVYSNSLTGAVSSGDLTGDGISEILLVNDSKLRVLVGKHLPDGTFTYELSPYWLPISTTQSIRTVKDMNGDGTSEVLCQGSTENSFILYSFSTDVGFTILNSFSINPWPTTGNLMGVYYADFNGDGKTDICYLQKEDVGSSSRWTCFSYGNNFTAPQKSNDSYSTGLSVADINNDGRADFFNLSFGYGKLVIGCSFTQPDGVSRVTINTDLDWNIPFNGSPVITSARINANGTMGLALVCSEFHPIGLNLPNSNQRSPLQPGYESLSVVTLGDYGTGANVIKTITDGFDVNTQIKYSYFGTTGPIYANFPLAKARFMDIVVSETYVDGENGEQWNRNKYQFDTPIVHLQGKGFLGFKERRTHSYQNNILDVTINDILVNNNKYFHLYTLKDSEWSMNGENQDKILSETNNEAEIKLPNPGNLNYSTVFVKSYTKTWDNDAAHSYKGIVIEKVNPLDVDNYGNIGKRTVLMDELETSPQPLNRCSWEETLETTYVPPDVNHWLISLPDHISKTTYHKPEDINIPDTYSTDIYCGYSYPLDPIAPLLEHTSTIPDHDQSLSTQKWYLYDSYGNIKSETIKANIDGQLQERTNEFVHSDNYNGRFLTSQTQKAPITGDQNIIYTYDPLTDNMLTKKDPNAIGTTTYEYDGLGRLHKTIFPDGTSTESIFDWSMNLTEIIPPPNALYYSTSFKNLYNQPAKWNKSFTFYDKYQRPVRTVKQGFNGEYINSDTQYDGMGRILNVSEPYFAGGSTTLATSYGYDNLGRLIQQNLPTGKSISVQFAGRTTKITRSDQHSTIWKETTLNITGKEDIINDPTGSITYSYDPASRLRSICAAGTSTNFEYDAAGNRTKLTDPDAGTTISTYNGFGELITQTDARGSQYTNTYDELGRIQISSLTPDNILTKYGYCSGSENGFGNIKNIVKSINNSNETRLLYFYDDLGRQEDDFEEVEGIYYRHNNDYNINSGMLETYTYPSLYKVKYEYNAYGYMNKVIDVSTSNVLWTATSANERGQITDYSLGNGLAEQKQFDQYGFPANYKVKNIANGTELHSQFYTFDAGLGNLITKDELHDGSCLTENYTYDPILNSRLTSWQVINGTQNYMIKYLNNGNINFKSDVTQSDKSTEEGVPTCGQYSYGDNAGPHAVTSIINPTPEYLASATGQSITYTGFNKVSSILQSDRKVIKKLIIEYGPDNQRIKSEYFNIIDSREVKLKTKYFFGDYEIETDNETGRTRQLHYLFASSGLFAIIERNTSTGIKTPYYIHSDYQGNYNLITSETGNVLERLSFDPWGRRRNSQTWDYTDVPTTFLFDRGYTGHEHLDNFGLINMNGRVYDPTLARFLSPDPVLQDMGNIQSHNRYSYCLNNPLKYTDPSGYFYDDPRAGRPLGDPFEGSSSNGFEFESGVPEWDAGFTNTFSPGNIPSHETSMELTATGQAAGMLFMFLMGSSITSLFDLINNGEVAKQAGGLGLTASLDGIGKPDNQHEYQTWTKLQPAEKTLVESNPDAAFQIYGNMQTAFDITQTLFPDLGQHNDAADAFRHAFYNAMNARDVGVSLTMDFSYAHEAFPGNPALERIMDINNNLIGIGIGASGNYSNVMLIIKVYNTTQSGGLLMIENGSLVKTHYP